MNLSNCVSLVDSRAFLPLKCQETDLWYRSCRSAQARSAVHVLCRTSLVYYLHSLCLPGTSEWTQLFCPLSLYGNGMNYVFWATLAAFKAILRYNVKKREAVRKRFPGFHSFALARLLCWWSSKVCKVKLVLQAFFFNSKKRGYQKDSFETKLILFSHYYTRSKIYVDSSQFYC